MSNRFPAEATTAATVATDFSGVTTAGASVEILAYDESGVLTCIQNLSDSDTLYLSITGAASAQPGSFRLLPNGYLELPGINAVTAYADIAAPFTAVRFRYADV
jgi:hypothetical protein